MNKTAEHWIEMLKSSQQTFIASMVPAMAESMKQMPNASAAPPVVQRQFADLQATWRESIEKWTAFMKESSGKTVPTLDELNAMFSPTSWNGKGGGAFETSLRHVIEGPRYATLWDLERKLARLQSSLIQRDREVMAYQAIVQRAWNTALKRFSDTFTPSTATSPVIWRAMTDRWLATANDVLVETYRTDEFIEAQRRMLRAASDYRLQEREIAEAWCEACHVPTRSEMDEMQRTVTELRREVRLLKRQAPTAAVARVSSAPAGKARRASQAGRVAKGR